MAVLPHFLVQAALRAPHHVQVRIARVTPPPTGPGAVVVDGEVIRVFRGPLTPGTPVRVAVHALREGESPPPSGILWLRWDDVVAAAVIELWGDDGDDGLLHVAGSQCTLLDAPTDAPRHPLRVEDARPPDEPLRERLDRAGLAIGGWAALVVRVLCIVGGFGIALAALMR